MIKEPVLSKTPKCTTKGCWYGIIENDDKTVGLCPVCLGTGVVTNTLVNTVRHNSKIKL